MNPKLKKQIILNLPYVLIGLYAGKLGEAWRLAEGTDSSSKLLHIMNGFADAFRSPFPSFMPSDLLIGILCGCVLRLAVYLKGKNAKKYRKNVEYGSACWGKHEDILPFMDPDPRQNIILTATEGLTIKPRVEGRPTSTGRNKNVMIIGGSGSGKTRFFIKPQILQLHSSYVICDPKGVNMTSQNGATSYFRCAA